MICFRLRRLLPLVRVFVLALFAWGMVLLPVLAAVGEMHELAHAPPGTHAHGLDADDAVAELGRVDQHAEDGAGTLHVLLHFAHCCGATAAMPPVMKQLAVLPLSHRLAIANVAVLRQVRFASPFKPPISA